MSLIHDITRIESTAPSRRKYTISLDLPGFDFVKTRHNFFSILLHLITNASQLESDSMFQY